MKSTYTGWKRIIKACTYSYNGFCAAFKSEASFRQDLLLCALGIIALLFLPLSSGAKCLLFASLLLILICELINTAIETIIDLISPNYHCLAKKAKDIGSLIVLISLANALIIWLITLSAYLL